MKPHGHTDIRRTVESACVLAALAILVMLVLGQIDWPEVPDAYASLGREPEMPAIMVLPPDSILNTGGLEELDTLPGIGPVYAANIIATREVYGPFVLPQNLLSVSGIGEKRLANIMAYIDEPLVTFTDLPPVLEQPY